MDDTNGTINKNQINKIMKQNKQQIMNIYRQSFFVRDHHMHFTSIQLQTEKSIFRTKCPQNFVSYFKHVLQNFRTETKEKNFVFKWFFDQFYQQFFAVIVVSDLFTAKLIIRKLFLRQCSFGWHHLSFFN